MEFIASTMKSTTFVRHLDKNTARLAGVGGQFGFQNTKCIWDLYLDDQVSRQILQEWVEERRGKFNNTTMSIKQCSIRDAKLVEYANDQAIRAIVVEDQKPQVGMNNVTLDTVAYITVLWTLSTHAS